MTCALDLRPHAPVLPPATIERARLHEALDAHRSRPLTLVSAPAGWGKTVLLASWAAARGAAWLTIGSRHSDAARLLSDADAALRAAGGDAPALVLDDVHLLLPDAMSALGELVAGGTSSDGGGALRSRPAAGPHARRRPARRAARRRAGVHRGRGRRAVRGDGARAARRPGRAARRAHRGLGRGPAPGRAHARRRGRPGRVRRRVRGRRPRRRRLPRLRGARRPAAGHARVPAAHERRRPPLRRTRGRADRGRPTAR